MRKNWLRISYFLAASLAGCTHPLPPLLQGVAPVSHGDSPEFVQRLKDRFPAGSTEIALMHELRLNGFQPDTGLDASQRAAPLTIYGNLSYLCRRDADVRWSAESGRLTAISGNYRVTCP
jgi:hypothetical protein